MLWASHAVSLFSGRLAGSRNSQKGHPRGFDGHCLAGLAGWIMAGPCWGLGKPGSVFISDVQWIQELLWPPHFPFSAFYTRRIFLLPSRVASLELCVCHRAQVVCRSFWKVWGKSPCGSQTHIQRKKGVEASEGPEWDEDEEEEEVFQAARAAERH